MLQEFRLFFPVYITLIHGAPGRRTKEPNLSSGICHHYVQEVNRAFLDLPMTNATDNGLLRYFQCDDTQVMWFVSGSIKTALPQIAYFYDGKLYGVMTYVVDSVSLLPDAVIDALKEDLRRQLASEWGRNDFDIPLHNAIFYVKDGGNHLDREWRADVRYKKLRDAWLNVRVSAEEPAFIDTMEELKRRLAL